MPVKWTRPKKAKSLKPQEPKAKSSKGKGKKEAK